MPSKIVYDHTPDNGWGHYSNKNLKGMTIKQEETDPRVIFQAIMKYGGWSYNEKYDKLVQIGLIQQL